MTGKNRIMVYGRWVLPAVASAERGSGAINKRPTHYLHPASSKKPKELA
jgi:hypothetical protein